MGFIGTEGGISIVCRKSLFYLLLRIMPQLKSQLLPDSRGIGPGFAKSSVAERNMEHPPGGLTQVTTVIGFNAAEMREPGLANEVSNRGMEIRIRIGKSGRKT